MICRIVELRHKEVINSSNGCRLGFVDDIEVDTVTSQVRSIIVFGRPRCFGLLGRCEDINIPWSDIKLIGEDTILVDTNMKYQQKKSKAQRFIG
ncbi:MAG: YlmC/YmxH family sporulation protein [Ruminococcus sp.]|nr:YlmC/YmxH family sporulation protein [Ruminococcus sp.]